MARLSDTTIKVQVRVTPELWKEIGETAYSVGQNKTSFASMLVKIGYNIIIRTLEPEKVLSEDELAKLISAVERGKKARV